MVVILESEMTATDRSAGQSSSPLSLKTVSIPTTRIDTITACVAFSPPVPLIHTSPPSARRSAHTQSLPQSPHWHSRTTTLEPTTSSDTASRIEAIRSIQLPKGRCQSPIDEPKVKTKTSADVEHVEPGRHWVETPVDHV